MLVAWQFMTLILSALLMGTTFGHVLEMPAKLQLDGPRWMMLQQTLYRAFATIGGLIESGAIVASVGWTLLVREQRYACCASLTAAICLATGFVVWLLVTNMANSQVLNWSLQTIPSDWMRWRERWEYSHAARFALHLLAFGALLTSVRALGR